ncbi:MAG TPA: hypothetical protein ENF73_06260 [Proteobacteria bacterium]|nr:hypothetical protein [Pseudomonadota bacterium]
MKSRDLAIPCLLSILIVLGCTSYYGGTDAGASGEKSISSRTSALRLPDEFVWGVYLYRVERLQILADAGIPWFAYFLK